MTFLVISAQGVERKYPVEPALNDMTLADLYAVLVNTGMSRNDIVRGVQRLADVDADTAMRDPELLKALMAFVWCARRAAGEQLSFEDANAFGWDDFRFEGDEGAEPEAEGDPTAVPVSSGRKSVKGTSRKRSAAA